MHLRGRIHCESSHIYAAIVGEIEICAVEKILEYKVRLSLLALEILLRSVSPSYVQTLENELANLRALVKKVGVSS